MTPADLTGLSEDALSDWMLSRRWFGSKAREVANVRVMDLVTLAEGPPTLVAALVEARFPGGTHAVYQLLLSLRDGVAGQDAIAKLGSTTVVDALADPQACELLGGLLREQASPAGERAHVRFHWLGAMEPPRPGAAVRAVGAEQSNSSVVFDDALVLKAFRRLEAGENPELEMLRFLSARGFANIAPLAGWYRYDGDLIDATFGVVQRFIPNARDGWELALDELGDDPDRFVGRLEELGAVIGRMHTILGSETADPAFAPEHPTDETLALLTATVDEEIERIFIDLPHTTDVARIDGRGEEVRDRLRMLTNVGARGKLIRHHGDLHLGQTLLAGDGDGEDAEWIIIDFEGEPARSLLERRRKRSGLRDVAGMLRSFAYVASASHIQRGRPAPEGWEERAREAFLAGYLGTVDDALLPPGEANTRRLLSVYELEKSVYELRYELNNRPDWVPIPVAGIARLLEEPI